MLYDKDKYQVVPPQQNAVSKVLSEMWITLGKPATPLTKSGQKMMEIIIATWEDLFPKESKEWLKDRADYKKAEKSISEQVKKRTGRSLASYPFYIYQVMKTLFPNFDPTERRNCFKMVKKWPMFQFANKV